MTPAPERRWFRYSLRTLFVVVTVLAVPAGWIGYALNHIRLREQFVIQEENLMRLKSGGHAGDCYSIKGDSAGIYGVLGDHQYYLVYVFVDDIDRLTADEIGRVKRAESLFPEAIVGSIQHGGGETFLYHERALDVRQSGDGLF